MKKHIDVFKNKPFLIFALCFILLIVLFGPLHSIVNADTCEPGKLCNPLGQTKTLDDFVVKITTAALKIGVPIAALFIMWAGFKYVTAAGDEKAVKDAHKIFLWTIVGTAILLAASLLATVLTGTITQVVG